MDLTALLKAIFHGVQKHAWTLCLNINKINLTLFPNHTERATMARVLSHYQKPEDTKDVAPQSVNERPTSLGARE